MHSDKYTLGFAAVITIVCSFLLAVAYNALGPKQEVQRQLFVNKNILKVLNVMTEEQILLTPIDEINKIFNDPNNKQYVKRMFIDKNGTEVNLDDKQKREYSAEGTYKSHGFEYNKVNDISSINDLVLEIYQYSENGYPKAYCFQTFGKGLWSTCYGYVSFDASFSKITNITFYKHGETPGLGAEIEQTWFQQNFIGKEIFNDKNELVSVTVKKGKVDNSIEKEKRHFVDGISGATITSNGLSAFMLKDINLFMGFINKVRLTNILPTDSLKTDSVSSQSSIYKN